MDRREKEEESGNHEILYVQITLFLRCRDW